MDSTSIKLCWEGKESSPNSPILASQRFENDQHFEYKCSHQWEDGLFTEIERFCGNWKIIQHFNISCNTFSIHTSLPKCINTYMPLDINIDVQNVVSFLKLQKDVYMCHIVSSTLVWFPFSGKSGNCCFLNYFIYLMTIYFKFFKSYSRGKHVIILTSE